jgi:hypothetical protein
MGPPRPAPPLAAGPLSPTRGIPGGPEPAPKRRAWFKAGTSA